MASLRKRKGSNVWQAQYYVREASFFKVGMPLRDTSLSIASIFSLRISEMSGARVLQGPHGPDHRGSSFFRQQEIAAIFACSSI